MKHSPAKTPLDGSARGLSDPSEWVNTHGDYLYAYSLRRLRNPSLAQDVVQETFLAALESASSFVGRSSERTWFTGILKNKIIDHFRQAARTLDFEVSDSRTRAADDNFVAGGFMGGTWIPERRPSDWAIDPTDELERREFRQLLGECLDSMDQRYALVFVLREMEEINSNEICNILKVNPTNLRVMLYRARKLLRRCLETKWINTEGKR